MKRRHFLETGAKAFLASPFIFNRVNPILASSSVSQVVCIHDGLASSLEMERGKIPNSDGVIVDLIKAFEVNRTRLSAMMDEAVLKLSGKPTVGKAWESLFPAGHPNSDTSISIKLNLSYGQGSDEENDWSSMICPFGPKVALSDAIILGLTQMMDGTFPIGNITIFDTIYAGGSRWKYSLVQGFRPVQGNGFQVYKDKSRGNYQIHWVNPRSPFEIPQDAPRFIAAPDYSEEYQAPQRIKPPVYRNDFMINVAISKDHREAGITGVMKNTYGCTDNPVGTHGSVWRRPDSPYAGTRLCVPVFYKSLNDITPCILNVMDAITGVYHGGPLSGRVFHANMLAVSNDPVALDTFSLNLINKHRELNGYPLLSSQDGRTKDDHPHASFLHIAEEVHGLGSGSQQGLYTYDLTSRKESYNIPAMDKPQSRVSEVIGNGSASKLNIFLDTSKRDHMIESRIEDLKGNVIREYQSVTTPGENITLEWDHRDKEQNEAEEEMYVWHVLADGMEHSRIVRRD